MVSSNGFSKKFIYRRQGWHLHEAKHKTTISYDVNERCSDMMTVHTQQTKNSNEGFPFVPSDSRLAGPTHTDALPLLQQGPFERLHFLPPNLLTPE